MGVDRHITTRVPEVEQPVVVDIGTVVGIVVALHPLVLLEHLYQSVFHVKLVDGVAFADPDITLVIRFNGADDTRRDRYLIRYRTE